MDTGLQFMLGIIVGTISGTIGVFITYLIVKWVERNSFAGKLFRFGRNRRRNKI